MRPTARFGRAVVLVALACLPAVGCENDPLSGPVDQVGPPLLDMSLGLAGNSATNPSGSVSTNAARDTLRITIDNLPPLAGGASYQVLLVSDTASTGGAVGVTLHPIAGQLTTVTRSRRPIDRDNSVIVADTAVTSGQAVIAAADTNMSFRLVVTDADITGGTIASLSHVLIVVTGSPIASQQTISGGERRGFAYAQYRSGASYLTRSLTFGRFTADPTTRKAFTQGGRFDGAFWGTRVRANFYNLTRPPEGFQYAAWLIDDRTGIARRLGSLQTPGGTVLTSADVDTTGSPSVILSAQLRSDTTVIGRPFDDFTRFALLVEPKGTTPPSIPSAALVVTGDVPQSVASRHASPGKLSGTVTSTSSATVEGTTLYLTGVESTSPLLVTNAAANGTFLFRTVHVGQYRLWAIPPGGSQAAGPVSVTIGQRPGDTGGMVGDSVSVSVQIP